MTCKHQLAREERDREAREERSRERLVHMALLIRMRTVAIDLVLRKVFRPKDAVAELASRPDVNITIGEAARLVAEVEEAVAQHQAVDQAVDQGGSTETRWRLIQSETV